MDTILDRIYRARVEILRNNQTPKAVYLGAEEYSLLLRKAHGNGAVTYYSLTMDGRARVFNMELYEVDAPTYFRVV